MLRSDEMYLGNELRVISEMEDSLGKLKKEKLNYIQKLEKKFRKNCSLEEAQRRLKDNLDRNPKGEEMIKIKKMEQRIIHLVKRLDQKKEWVEKIEKDAKERDTQ